MQRYSASSNYKSGFHVFLPLVPINHPHVLFPDIPAPSISYFLINAIILHSNELHKVCLKFGWNFEETNRTRMALGLHFEEFHLVETSLKEVIKLESATILFHYIRLYLQEGINDMDTQEGNRPFFKTLLYWVSRKYNEYLLDYKKGLIQVTIPVLSTLGNLPYQDQKSYNKARDFAEVAELARHQSVFKELKHKLKKEGSILVSKEKASWKSSLDGGKLSIRSPVYKGKKPIELLLEGKISSLISLLSPMGYTLSRIQESVKYVSLYFLAQGHFGLDYACFLMEQVGLNVDNVLYEYYTWTLRKDVRKKINKYFKAKGKQDMDSPVMTSFLKINEFLSPLDSVTIAMRRKWAERPAVRPNATTSQRFNNLYNLWGDNNASNTPKNDSATLDSQKPLAKELPSSLVEFVKLMNSFVSYTFEIDDFTVDEPGAQYLGKEYALTRHFRNSDLQKAKAERREMGEDRESETPVEYGKHPFSLEDFKAFDRRMHEINLQRNHMGHQRFKPKMNSKRNQWLLDHLSVILSNFLGRRIEAPEAFLEHIDISKVNGYFQMKVKHMQKLEPNQIMSIIFQKLSLDAADLMILLGSLTYEEKLKYITFLLEYSVQRKDVTGLLQILGWMLQNRLFQEYFCVENSIIGKIPQCLAIEDSVFSYIFQNFCIANNFYFNQDNVSLAQFIGLLAHNQKFSYHDKLSKFESPSKIASVSDLTLSSSPRIRLRDDIVNSAVRYFESNGLIFTLLEFFKRFNLDVDSFLTQNDLTNSAQKAFLLSLQGEKSFGKIISLFESENVIKPKKALSLDSSFIKSDRDLYWEYLICHMKYGRERPQNSSSSSSSLQQFDEVSRPSEKSRPRDTIDSAGVSSIRASEGIETGEKSLSVFEVFKPGSLISYFLLEHITHSEAIFTEDIQVPPEEFFNPRWKEVKESDEHHRVDDVEVGNQKLTKLKAICALVLFGLPFTAFISIYSPNPPYAFLFNKESKKSTQEQFDLNELSNLVAGIKEPKDDPERQIEVYEILKWCFQILLRRPFDLCFFNSYLALIKLLKLNSEFFLVNTSVYRRIYIYLHEQDNRTTEDVFELYFHSENIFNSKQSQFEILTTNINQDPNESSYTQRKEAKFQPLVDKMDIFVEIFSQNLSEHLNVDFKPSRVRGTKLIEILQYLEQATISMESVMGTVKDMEKYGKMVQEMESPWGLVSKFCTLHSIPSSLKLLDEISAKNDWLRLLLELDVQKCSVETAREFINKYFHHAVLKRHLMNSLEEAAANDIENSHRHSNYAKYSQNIEELISRDIKKEILENEEIRNGSVQDIVIRIMLKIREIFTRRLERVDFEEKEDSLQKFLHRALIEIAENTKIEIFCLFAVFVHENDVELAYFKYLDIGKRRLVKEEKSPEMQEERENSEIGFKGVRDLIKWCKHDIKELLKTTKVYFGRVSFLYLLKGIEKALENDFEEMHSKLLEFEELFLKEISIKANKNNKKEQKKEEGEKDREFIMEEDNNQELEEKESEVEIGEERQADKKEEQEENNSWRYLTSAEFIENFIEKLIHTQILEERQVLKVLESFHQIRFSKNLEDWYVNLIFIQKIKEKASQGGGRPSGNLQYLKGSQIQDLIFEPFEVYILLLEYEMFQDATVFSARYSFEQSYIGLVQIHKLITRALKGGKSSGRQEIESEEEEEEEEQGQGQEGILNSDHKQLIDTVLVSLIQSQALVYQSAYYLKYLTSMEGFSLWDQIYLLSISHRLMEQLAQSGVIDPKFDRFKKKVEVQKDVLLYAFFHKELRKYFFENKRMDYQKVLFQVEDTKVMSNVSFFHAFETLVVRTYINALSNFDFPFIENLSKIYGIFIQEKEVYVLIKFLRDNIVGKAIKISLKSLLEIFDFRPELEVLAQAQKKLAKMHGDNIFKENNTDKEKNSSLSSTPGRVTYSRQRDPQLSTIIALAQTFTRVKQSLKGLHDLDVFMRGYIYYCAMMSMSAKNDSNTMTFFSLEEIFIFSKTLSLKQMFELLLNSPVEDRAEVLATINFMLEYNNMDVKDLICQYFDFAHEELASSFETRSFVEKLKNTKKYHSLLPNLYAFSIILNQSELRLIAGMICINYLKSNYVSPWSKSTLLGLAYFLLCDNIRLRPYLQRVISLAISFIRSLLEQLDLKKENQVHEALDQIGVVLLIYEWNPYLLWTLSELLGSQGEKSHLWKELFVSLGPKWGCVLVERVVLVGHNLPPLESELQEAPLTLAHLVFAKARKYLLALLMDLDVEEDQAKTLSMKKGINILKRKAMNNELKTESEDYVSHMNLIGSQLVYGYKYYCLGEAYGLAKKTLQIAEMVYSFIDDLQNSTSL